MRIGEVASQAGVNVETLRYYERRGLLAEPERLGSGYRAYSPEAVRIVRFVKQAQQLGFSLAEVGDLLRLADSGRASCEAIRELAGKKLTEIELKIMQLQAICAALHQLAETCQPPRTQRECRLLDAVT